MISPGQIAFDIDGVFADTMTLFLQIARKDYGINHIKYSDITQYYLEECLDIAPEIINVILARILEGDFDVELEPIDGSCKVLSAIVQEGPLLFVSARSTVSAIEEWVNKMLPPALHPVEVVATGSFEAKADVLKERGIEYFVEDCLDVCFSIQKQDITPLVFHQPWNCYPHPFQEVCNWAEIRGLIDFNAPSFSY